MIAAIVEYGKRKSQLFNAFAEQYLNAYEVVDPFFEILIAFTKSD